MPKAHLKSTASDNEDPDRYINPAEAKAHVDTLDKVMTMIEDQVEKQNTTDLLETALTDMKEILATLTPTMQLADTSMVSWPSRISVLTYCYRGQTLWIKSWRKYCQTKKYRHSRST